MSSYEVGVFAFLVATPTALLTSALSGGCSAASDKPSSAEAGVAESAVLQVNPPPPQDDVPLTTCRQDCQATHRAAVPKDEAVDTCWNTYCQAQCVQEEPDDGGILDMGALDGGTCTSPVVTISLSCDLCTIKFCCAAWDACFQDPSCADLNACYQGCVE